MYHLIHIFLDLLYNYAKFHHCRICVTDFRLYGPPSVSSPEKTPPWIGLKNHQKRSFCHWDYYQLSHYQFSHYLSMDYRMMASSVLCSNHKKKINIILTKVQDYFKGATKSYFTHYSCVVIILFKTGLQRSAFSTISYRTLLVFRLSLLSAFFVWS